MKSYNNQKNTLGKQKKHLKNHLISSLTPSQTYTTFKTPIYDIWNGYMSEILLYDT